MRTVFILSLAFLVVIITTAQAVHVDGLFELGDGETSLTPGSGDILGDGVQPGPDWSNIFNSTGELIDTDGDGVSDAVEVYGGLDALFFLDDLAIKGLTDDTTFSGSNKNNDPISTWQWDTGNVPVKDDIANAYIYGVINPGLANLIVYAGIERLAPEGASHIDIELNQETIALDKQPACGSDGTAGPEDGRPCEFTGIKTFGDILVVMDFEVGGTLGFVEVRQWDGTEYVLKVSLEPDPLTDSAEGCNEETLLNGVLFPEDIVCAVNNGAGIPGGPWPSYDRHGAVLETELPENTFTEVGIDVTALLGTTPCLGTVQVKTRSSPSFNSELKDFALGRLDICGSLTVVKDSLPDDGQDFSFTTDVPGQSSGFSLDDDGDAALSNTITFLNLPPEDYYVTEGAVPGGWEFTGLSCDDVPPADITGSTAIVTVDFGEHVTCTYENTKLGEIIVEKVTVPSGDSQVFGFTVDGSGSALSDEDFFTVGDLQPGDYDVKETVPVGWELTDISCTDTVGAITNGVTVTIDPGETVTCTFTNTKQGKIIIDKVTVPPGESQSFLFTPSYPLTSGSTFSLTDATTPHESGFLSPNTSYTVAETVPGGWDLTQIDCDDGNSFGDISTGNATINLGAGEIVTCTFTDTERGSITIIKDAIFNHAQDFAYTTTSSTDTPISNFTLDDDSGAEGEDGTNSNTRGFPDLKPGDYTVTESVPGGWELTDLTCSDTLNTSTSGATASITLDPGEDVTCTYEDTQLGKIITVKVTSPSTTEDFLFSPSYGTGATFSLTNGESEDSGFLTAGTTYSVTETELTGWILKSIVCDDGNSTGSIPTATISLEVGETVTCTFTNIQPSEGCTPGFWKNHLDAWPDVYEPNHSFFGTFGAIFQNIPSGITLLGALELGGGGPKALTRHAAAALLNAAALDGFFRTDQVIKLYQDAVNGEISISTALKTLSDANELGCPIN
jgi:hypothetical protein